MHKIKTTILILTAIAVLQSCSENKQENTEETKTEQKSNLITVSKKQFERSEMQTGKITKKLFKEKIRTTGKITVSPKGKALINSLFPGIINNVFVLPGQKVVKGQKLCSITSLEIVSLQQDFSETANKLENLKQNYLRKKSLHENKVLSDKEFEKAKSEYFGTLGKYNGLKQKIRMMKLNPDKISGGKIYSEIYLTAPFSGYITEHNCMKGMSVSSGDNLFKIINLNSLQLEFYVFEKDVSNIKIGSELFAFTPENENLKYKGKTTAIGKSVNPETKTVTCYASFDIKDTQYPAENMFMNVDLISAEFEKYAVPENTIVYSETESYVLQLSKKDNENYYFIKKDIKPGQTYNGYTEISLNDTLNMYLTNGAYNIIAE